jgi:hypothetical protein
VWAGTNWNGGVGVVKILFAESGAIEYEYEYEYGMIRNTFR